MSIDPVQHAGLPVVNQALEPAWVRHGSTATKQNYQAAQAFEQMLVEQFAKAMTATAGLGGEGEGGSEGTGAAPSQLSSLLPQALAGGVTGAGGLGLAAQLTRELDGVGTSATQARGAGGTSA